MMQEILNQIHNSNLEKFLTNYKEELLAARLKYPNMYVWPLEELDLIHTRMSKAIFEGSFNKDSIAIKHTCKRLKIKHTYKAIETYIRTI